MEYIKRTNKRKMVVRALFSVAFVAFAPRFAFAFSCTSNGTSIGGAGTFTIPIDVVIDKNDRNIMLTDLASYTTCQGLADSRYKDALRVTNATIPSDIVNAGFSGYLDVFGAELPMPPSGGACAWPDGSCNSNYGNITRPLGVKIGLKKTRNITSPLTLPAGTTIATLSVEQRSMNTWGWNKTWRFTLKSDLVIPTYACRVNNPNQTVVMDTTNSFDIRNHGVGAYPVSKRFSIGLDCDPNTSVSIQFDGAAMPGHSDVLVNTTAGNDSLGIQIQHNDIPVPLGSPIRVIENSGTLETVEFTGHYYYNGGLIFPSPVTATSTFTMTYN